jgi:hypothetical protein
MSAASINHGILFIPALSEGQEVVITKTEREVADVQQFITEIYGGKA